MCLVSKVLYQIVQICKYKIKFIRNIFEKLIILLNRRIKSLEDIIYTHLHLNFILHRHRLKLNI